MQWWQPNGWRSDGSSRDWCRTAWSVRVSVDSWPGAWPSPAPETARSRRGRRRRCFATWTLAPSQRFRTWPTLSITRSPLPSSSRCWGLGANTAPATALGITCDRADLQDGQDILELGCGWGSLSLWMAERYPAARIVAVSNSNSQRAYIEARAREAGLANLAVVTADMNDFETERRFDRVVSVEMFEHMRNWRRLLGRIHGWLRPEGRLLMHCFCHRSTPYFFEDEGAMDWMSRYFFSGGLMPSDDLPLRLQDPMRLVQRWRWGGRHYERTLNTWLANMDARRAQIVPILAGTYGRDQSELWWNRWRIFFMACAELFGYDKGQQWWVSHYLFERPPGR
jgi:cyclopropane-fatty-acyl-phospholipid synthase